MGGKPWCNRVIDRLVRKPATRKQRSFDAAGVTARMNGDIVRSFPFTYEIVPGPPAPQPVPGKVGLIEMLDIVNSVDLRRAPYPIKLKPDTYQGKCSVLFFCTVNDRDTGQPLDISMRDVVEAYTMTRDEFVKWLFEKYKELWIHEAAETFVVAGQRPFDPHPPVSYFRMYVGNEGRRMRRRAQ